MLESGRFQKILQPQLQCSFGHGGTGADALADINDFLCSLRYISLLTGRDYKVVQVHVRAWAARVIQIKLQLVYPKLVQTADRFPAHLVAQVNKQNPASGGQLLQPANHIPQKSKLNLGDLRIQRKILPQIAAGFEGVGGGYVQIIAPIG